MGAGHTDARPKPRRRPVIVAARLLALSVSIGAVLIAAIIVGLRAADYPHRGVPAAISTSCSNNSTELPVLLLGDSYSTGLDVMLTAVLCNSGIAHNPQVTTLAAGGETIPGHLAGGESAQFAGHTVIVLQDQSQVPGLGPHYAEFEDSITALDELGSDATQAGARLVLFQTWGHQHGDPGTNLADLFPDYPTMQNRLISGYADYLFELRAGGAAPDASIAPVGQAWMWIETRDPALFASLYAGDGSHPSVKGTYLSALVLAQQIGRTVLPASFVWAPPGVSKHDAHLLQQAALAVWSA